MWFAYLLACIPTIIGAVLWVTDRKVVWQEWAIATAIAFATAGIFHATAILGMTADTETWSGKIYDATFDPEWVERYTETYTTTDKKGNTHTHTRTCHRTHYDEWSCRDTIGCTHSITPAFFADIRKNFNSYITKDGGKSGLIRGDPNIYEVHNTTNYNYPVTAWKHFENRVKAAPSLFSYSPVPEGTPVFPYPANDNWQQSNRLLGTIGISILEWDRMNARLGPSKKVNVILINFGERDSSISHLQEAKWIGGKKNDLVLCYGKGWSYVFGWTEQDLVKLNLQTILLGKVDNDTIPVIEKEISQNYRLKDWSKFDYISVEPPTWSFIVLVIVMLFTEGGFWIWALIQGPEYFSDFRRNRWRRY